jgi:poly[(R)-3-hydroxyalkanoate] polymerase subunit PhaC
MDISDDANQIMQSIATKSLKLIQTFYQNPSHPPVVIKQFIELTEDYQAFMTALFSNPENLIKMQMDYWQDALHLMNQQFIHWLDGKEVPIDDKRFSNEQWTNNPFFNLLSQQYLLATKHIQALVDSVEYKDENAAKKINFFAKQYLDALSPSNFAYTNPQVMNETVKSGGKNLLQGLENLLDDLNQGKANFTIKMTDFDAFSVGKNLAITPGKIIYQNDLIQLIQYKPATPKVKEIPLLIIPPWINKYYILDLSEKNSFVNYLVSQGITVFMISWVNPDKSHKDKNLFSYMELGPISAIETIQKQCNVDKVNALGFCVGGTLLASLIAYFKAKNTNMINCTTFLTSLIDFSDPGDIAIYIDEEQINILEQEMNKKGYLDGNYMATTFNSLRANDLIWSFFIKNYLHGKNPVPFDILYWNNDSTNMPAKMHSQYLRSMYLHNDLIKPGKMKINNTALDVSQIDIPSFFISTQKDHIAPWKTTYNGFLALTGEKHFVLGGSGHIAGIVNPPEKKKYGYYTNENQYQDAHEWLESATHRPGSWWPYWLKWLKKHSGTAIKAREPDKGKFKPLEDAPGSYVKVKSE